MALGVDYSSTAPQLIQSSGQALVQGIRQIGQQISGALTELQTKRDLGAMAQEIQSLNPQSNEFPVQLTQLVTRHPLAVRDERGQMALSVLGKAHGAWQAGEAEARAFNRAMARDVAQDRRARDMFDYKREQGLATPQNVGGALVVPQDPVTGQPNVLLPAPSRVGSTMPFQSTAQGIMDRRTGEITRPALPKPNTAKITQKRLSIEGQLRDLNNDIDFDVKEHQRLLKEEADLTKEMGETDDATKKSELEFRRAVKIKDAEKVRKKIEDIRSKKLKLAEDLGMLTEEVEPELGVLPMGAAETELIPVGQVPAPVANANARIPVIGPDGKTGTVSAAQLESALQNGYKRR